MPWLRTAGNLVVTGNAVWRDSVDSLGERAVLEPKHIEHKVFCAISGSSSHASRPVLSVPLAMTLWCVLLEARQSSFYSRHSLPGFKKKNKNKTQRSILE